MAEMQGGQQQDWTVEARALASQYKQLTGLIQQAAKAPGTVDPAHLDAMKQQQAGILARMQELTGQNVQLPQPQQPAMPEMGPAGPPMQGGQQVDPSALIQHVLGGGM